MPLDEQDKKWLAGSFEAIQTRLDGIEDKVHTALAAVASRLEAVEARLEAVDAKLEAVDAKLEAVDARFEPLATREDVYNTETKLLKEFHKWASPVDSRLKSLSAAVRTLDIELEALKDRLSDLESGKQ